MNANETHVMSTSNPITFRDDSQPPIISSSMNSRKSGISAALLSASTPNEQPSTYVPHSASDLLTPSNPLDSPISSSPTQSTHTEPITFKPHNRQRSALLNAAVRYSASPNVNSSLGTSPTPSLSLDSSAGSIATQLSSITFAKDNFDGHEVVLKTARLSSSVTSNLSHTYQLNNSKSRRVEFVGFTTGNGDDSDEALDEEGNRITTGAEKEYIFLKELERAGVENVVRLKDSYVDENGEFTMVLPMMKKFTLSDVDLVTVRMRLKQLLTILASVHALHIAHLDVTPANIMLDPDTDHLTLIDFGLANRCQPHQLDLDSSTGSLTFEPVVLTNDVPEPATATAPSESALNSAMEMNIDELDTSQTVHPRGCGTPGFIAPEVLAGTATTTAPDIYSVGVLIGSLFDPFLPNFQLHILGSRLVGPTNTTQIARRLRNFVRGSGNSTPVVNPLSPPTLLSTRTYAETRTGSSNNLLLNSGHVYHNDRISLLRQSSSPAMYRPFTHSSSCPSLTSVLNDLNSAVEDSELDDPYSQLSGQQSTSNHDSEADEQLHEKIRHRMVLLAADLLWRMLHPNEFKRITAERALQHPFLSEDDEAFKGTELDEWTQKLGLKKGFCGDGWKVRSGGSILGGGSRDRIRVMYR